MPSNGQSWFARHCTPAPPQTSAPTCPCASCYGNNSSSRSSSTTTNGNASPSLGLYATRSIPSSELDSTATLLHYPEEYDEKSSLSRRSSTTIAHVERAE